MTVDRDLDRACAMVDERMLRIGVAGAAAALVTRLRPLVGPASAISHSVRRSAPTRCGRSSCSGARSSRRFEAAGRPPFSSGEREGSGQAPPREEPAVKHAASAVSPRPRTRSWARRPGQGNAVRLTMKVPQISCMTSMREGPVP